MHSVHEDSLTLCSALVISFFVFKCFFLFKQAHTKRQKNNVLSHQQAPYDHQFVCKAP